MECLARTVGRPSIIKQKSYVPVLATTLNWLRIIVLKKKTIINKNRAYRSIALSTAMSTTHEENQMMELYDMELYYEKDEWLVDVPWLDEEENSFNEYENQVETRGAKVFESRYKPVAQQVKPVPGLFPEGARVTRQFPEDPLASLPSLTCHPPEFVPTDKLTEERIDGMKLNEDGFLWPEEEKLFQHIFQMNERVLAFTEADRGSFREDYFSPYIIPTIPHIPWTEKNIPVPPGIRDEVINLLREKLEAGVYERCQSSYRSRWFCVLKKNGKLRLVHDLQKLNGITIREAGLPPILDDFVEPFAGRQCYTVFDLFWAFDGRKLDPISRDMTAFHSPLGQLRLTSMPMGFTNSPAEFQACMTFILEDEIPRTANVFIDDLPIKGPQTCYLDAQGNPEVLQENQGIRRFIWEHAQDVHRIMHRVGHAGIRISGLKAQVCRPNVVIVGQKCTPEGRVPEDDKVDKIRNWPVPTSVKEVRGFLGLCGTVRVWIKDFSEKVKPMRELTGHKMEFVWNERRQAAFEEMKDLISTAPALRPIDYTSSKPVVLSVDSSKYAVGYILSQLDENDKRRPARYGSVPLGKTESNYSQPKLELYGLYRALRRCRLYLIGVKDLHIEVDAKYIKGMLAAPDLQPNAVINRWIAEILTYPHKLIHVPAARHKGPDALSRRPMGEGEIIEYDEEDEWKQNVALHIGSTDDVLDGEEYSDNADAKASPKNINVLLATTTTQDAKLWQMFNFLQTSEMPEFATPTQQHRFITRARRYFVQDNCMYKQFPDRMPVRVLFDKPSRERVLEEAHDQLGHKGEKATFETIRQRFFWPFYQSDTRHYVRSCRECQIRSTKKTEVPLIISTPASLFAKVYLDVMHMPAAQSFTCIVACRDDLSGVSEVKALRAASSQEIARFFWEQIICRYGGVEQVVTDNGPETKGAFEILMKKYGIPHTRISPYNSKANGVVERGHFTLREGLIKACEGQVNRWPSLLPHAAFADRITIRRSTGFSPYYLLHGVHPILPMDLREATFMVQGFRSNMPHADLLALRIRQLQRKPEDLARAAKALRKTRLESKDHFERRFAHRLRKDAFQSGDLVLIRNTAIEKEMNRKHKPRYLGPYEVVRQTHNGSYIIKELNGDISRESVAAYRLLEYHPSNKDLDGYAIDSIDSTEDHYLSEEDEEEEDYDAQDVDLEDIIETDEADIRAEELSEEEDDDDEPVSQRTRSHRNK